MLQSMRNLTGSWFFRILIIVLAGTFVYFFSDTATRSGGTGLSSIGSIAKVNGKEIRQEAFQNQLKQNLRQYAGLAGAEGMPEQLKQFVANQTVQQLVSIELFRQEAEKFPVGVSNLELKEKIMQLPYFQKNGTFDPEMYHRINQQYHFEDDFRENLLTDKYRDFLSEAIPVHEEEILSDFRANQTTLDVDFILLDPKAMKEKIPINQNDLKAFQAKQGEAIKKYYEDHENEYKIKEQIKASHILVKLTPNASEAEQQQAQQKANDLYEKAHASPAKFAQLAREFSDDPGSKASGGELGFFPRGQMAPAFEDAAFLLQPGEISKPVKSPFGYHIILLEDRLTPRVRSLAEVEGEIARNLFLTDKLQELIPSLAKTWNREIKNGKNIVESLKKYGLSWEHAKGINIRSARFGSDEAAQKLNRLAFTLHDKQRFLVEPFQAGERFYVLKLIGRKEANPEEFPKQRETLAMQLRNQYSNRLIQKYLEHIKGKSKIKIAENFSKPSDLDVF